MPELLPFAGLRPQPALTGPLDGVICPPYDIISDQQRQQLLARSPYNIVRIELPAGDYLGAARLLAQWTAGGALAREQSPALYGYRMTYRAPDGSARHTMGVMGALVLEPPGRGILPHEQTTSKAKSDRLELIRATQANISPIWCLCSEPGLAEAVGALPAEDQLVRATDDDGTVHELWSVTSQSVHQAVARVVRARPLLVADGHHRYETALAYQAERDGPDGGAAAGPRDGGAAGSGSGGDARPGAQVAGPDAVLCYVVELSEEHLQVLAIHRVVSGLPPGTDVLSLLSGAFELRPTQAEGAALLSAMAAQGALAVVSDRGSYLALPRPHLGAGGPDLDSSRADAALSGLPAHHLAYEHDVPAAIAGVRSGTLDLAVLCRPATVAQIAATAHGGARMPPKTTFFWPKPRTGMVLRDFSEP
jgi:uncharacterized protein (DUF1015 family)